MLIGDIDSVYWFGWYKRLLFKIIKQIRKEIENYDKRRSMEFINRI